MEAEGPTSQTKALTLRRLLNLLSAQSAPLGSTDLHPLLMDAKSWPAQWLRVTPTLCSRCLHREPLELRTGRAPHLAVFPHCSSGSQAPARWGKTCCKTNGPGSPVPRP